MADSRSSVDKSARPSPRTDKSSRRARSQTALTSSPGDKRSNGEASGGSDEPRPLPRSHTPGRLASRSVNDGRHKPVELAIRQRSQSASQVASTPGLPSSKPLPASSSAGDSLGDQDGGKEPLRVSAPRPSSRPSAEGEQASNPPLASSSATESPRDEDSGKEPSRDPSAPRPCTALGQAFKPLPASSSAPEVRSDDSAKEHKRPAAARPSTAIGQASKRLSASAAATENAGDQGDGKGHKRSVTARPAPLKTHRGTLSTATKARGATATSKATRPPRSQHTSFPPLQNPKDAPEVEVAPPSGMYWSRAFVSGAPHPNRRAHTATVVGSNVYVFGGCDARTCFNSLYVLDADSFHWSIPHVIGEIPMPLRGMTCTTVGKIVLGGGESLEYYNHVYVLDTLTFRWTKPRIVGDKMPCERRAHSACLYKNGIYVFCGGDGVRALNDLWRLDVSGATKMSWRLVSSREKTAVWRKDYRPKKRGYHTANLVDGKLIVFGGSDGEECFGDVWVYDIESQVWKAVDLAVSFRRLSHTATAVGSYLFVIGGHDGNGYCNDVLLLNLVTMTWDKRRVYGKPPSVRGYHGIVARQPAAGDWRLRRQRRVWGRHDPRAGSPCLLFDSFSEVVI